MMMTSFFKKIQFDVNLLLNVFVVLTVTVAAASFINSGSFASETDQIQLSELSDADIEMILSVKDEMHDAAIQAN
jgi:hypothetical protein